MRKILLSLCLLLGADLCTGNSATCGNPAAGAFRGSSGCRPAHPGHSRPPCGGADFAPLPRRGYAVHAGTLYYNGREVEGASGVSFSDLGGGYAKDPWTVFYCGHKVERASAQNFRRLGGGYARDSWTVFYRGRKVKDASAMNFEYLGHGYARDAWAVYFEGRRIDTPPSAFRMPGNL